MDIIAFAGECGIRLHPVQRVVLKAVYGLPLDDIQIFPVQRVKRVDGAPVLLPVIFMTEASYMEALYREDRASFTILKKPVKAASLVLGRRSGSSMLLTLMLAYEVYLQLNSGIDHLSSFMMVAPTLDIAKTHIDRFYDLALKCPQLSERMANNTSSRIAFQTDRDIEVSGPWKGSQRQARASINVLIRASQAKGIRGCRLGLGVIDDADHLPQSSSEDAINAITTALSDDGRIIMLGAPSLVTEQTAFRARFKQYLKGPSDDALSLRIPTWEMQPDFPVLSMFNRDHPTEFWSEFGAEIYRTVKVVVPDRPLTHDDRQEIMRVLVAGAEGLEPPTDGFGIRCSAN